jgi:hypothetical protein
VLLQANVPYIIIYIILFAFKKPECKQVDIWYSMYKMPCCIIILTMHAFSWAYIYTGCLKKNAMEIQLAVVHHKRG